MRRRPLPSVPKPWRNPLSRHVALVMALKFLLLALLWGLCVRDCRTEPSGAQVRAALLPAGSPVVQPSKDPAP